MNAKIVFVNLSSRLAAARVNDDQYLVFEYKSGSVFKVGESIECSVFKLGPVSCIHGEAKSQVNILSPSMSFAKAKLVVAPWQDAKIEDLAV